MKNRLSKLNNLIEDVQSSGYGEDYIKKCVGVYEAEKRALGLSEYSGIISLINNCSKNWKNPIPFLEEEYGGFWGRRGESKTDHSKTVDYIFQTKFGSFTWVSN